ncbi:MAG TPA: heme biosynthesis HemY N-terminal domain-containing protein [Burkholderiaceae bacterium]|nr:heme biosynthesis HemY N-terminal domain-containing protein [Burkholderiaceae bacterium]
MTSLVRTLVVAALAVVAALIAQVNEGRVVFFLPPWRIDVSFNLFIVLAGVLAYAIYLGGRLLQKFADFPGRVRAYRQRREESGAQRALRDSLRALFEGRFARAERSARVALEVPGMAGLAAMLGARAAHRLQQFPRRDDWLRRADEEADVAVARLVAGAEMWIESRDNERALEAIDRLQGSGARHIHAMRIAMTARLQAGQNEEVIRSVRALEKHRAIHAAAALRFKRAAYVGLLAARRGDGMLVESAWRDIPEEDRRDPVLALEAARLLNAAGRASTAAAALEAALEEHWDGRLLDEYGATPAAARSQLERAEAWLARHPGDPALLRCLGTICLRSQLWGKARSYLEESLRQDPDSPATRLVAARLFEALGDEPTAAHHFRVAAVNAAGGPAHREAGVALDPVAAANGLRPTLRGRAL